ncbi:MAG TPA: nucleotide exchange factor GrpE [Ktedonobacteraceae bacterium]|nr:nucleotide exchange factor GrpE [Ktedonobacteraceae bacterium]
MRYNGNGQDFRQGDPQGQQERDEQANMLAELQLQFGAEQQKSEEYLDALRRTQADFINYKRRSTQEQQDARVAAQAAIIERLLPVLDDLGRALESAPAEFADQPWVEGIFLVRRRLFSTLEQMGVRQVGKVGEAFDPNIHDALMTQSGTGSPMGTVVQVTRSGYAMGDRIIRPAQVIVAGAA